MKHRVTLLTCILAVHLYGSSPAWERLPRAVGEDIQHIARVTYGILSAPLRWDAPRWELASTTVLFTTAVSAADARIQRLALTHRTPFLDRLFQIDEYHGSTSSGVISVSLYTTGLLLDIPQFRRLGLQAMEAFYLSGTVNLLFKIVVGRRRPYAADSPYQFQPFNGTTEYRSMPSGHVVTAVAVSTVFASAISHPLWKTLWYGSAALVAGARIYHNVHWFSDVIPATILGYAIARYIVQFPHPTQNTRSYRESTSRWQIMPTTGGIALIFRF